MSEKEVCRNCRLPFAWGEIPVQDAKGLRHWEPALCIERLRTELSECRGEYEAYKGTYDGQATRILNQMATVLMGLADFKLDGEQEQGNA